jgi:aspartate/methionine/tyrosine aminotransferase
MDVVARATQLEKEGRKICHLEVGQPSTGAPSRVLKAAKDILENNILAYTAALGVSDLRQKIASHYLDKYGVVLDSERIVVTTGSSAGFCLAYLGCFDVGDSIALCSSGYPCYRNIMKATGLNAVNIPVNKDFKITKEELNVEISRRCVAGEKKINGLILSSPGNPTGAMLSPSELKDLCDCCKENNIIFLSDEIYHGISFGPNGTKKEEASAVQFSSSCVVINSFSKYFSMTGWRLGWMVVPTSLIDVMNRLSQNLYINAPTLSQMAACYAFDPECKLELESHCRRYTISRQVQRFSLECHSKLNKTLISI